MYPCEILYEYNTLFCVFLTVLSNMHTEKMEYIFNVLLSLHSWISSRATEAKDKQLMANFSEQCGTNSGLDVTGFLMSGSN